MRRGRVSIQMVVVGGEEGEGGRGDMELEDRIALFAALGGGGEIEFCVRVIERASIEDWR